MQYSGVKSLAVFGQERTRHHLFFLVNNPSSVVSTSCESVKRRQLARVLAGKKERLPIAAVEVAQVPIEQS